MRTSKLTLASFSPFSTREQRQQMAVDLVSPIDPSRFFDYEPIQAEKKLYSVFADLFALAERSDEATDAVTGIRCFLQGPLLHRENPPFKLRGLPWDAVVFNDLERHTAMEPAHNWCPWHKLIYVRFAGSNLFRLANDLRAIGRAVVDGPELSPALASYRSHLFEQYAAVLRVIGYSKLGVLWDDGLECDICHRLEAGPRRVRRGLLPRDNG